MNGFGKWRWLIVVAIIVVAPGGARAGYEITDLGVLPNGGNVSGGTGLNLAGDVVGTAESGTGIAMPFVYNADGLQALSTLVKGLPSYGVAINDGGTVVADGTTASGQLHAFVAGGAASGKDLGVLPGWTSSIATGLNDNGQISGYGTLGPGSTHAFVASTGGTITDLGTFGYQSAQANGLNLSGQIVGSVTTSSGLTYAFTASTGGGNAQVLGGLFGGTSVSVGTAINNAGEVVGYGGFGSSMDAFRYLPGGSLQSLGTLPGATASFATAVNNFGQIVGYSTFGSGTSEAFVYSNQSPALIPLNQLLINASGWTLTSATGINDYGQITGTGLFDGATHAFLLTPEIGVVPEPSSWILTGLGLLGLLAVRARLTRARTGDPACGERAVASRER